MNIRNLRKFIFVHRQEFTRSNVHASIRFFLKTTLNLDVYMFYVPVKKKYKDLRILFMKILDI